METTESTVAESVAAESTAQAEKAHTDWFCDQQCHGQEHNRDD